MAANTVLSPNEKHKELSTLLEKIEPKLGLVAPREYDTARFREVMLDILMGTPDLLKCAETPKGRMSFALACAHIVQLGLDPSRIRKHVYVVPFMNRKDGYMEAVVIPDARGLIELMRRSGKFEGIVADVVYHGDTIKVVRAPEPSVIHEPLLDRKFPDAFWPDENDASKPCVFNMILGFYAMLRIKGEEPIVRWWPLDMVMKTKNSSRAGSSGPWVNFFVQMGIKTAVKDAARHAPLSPDVSDAIALDERIDSGETLPAKADLSDVITITEDEPGADENAAPASKTEEAKAKLRGKKAEQEKPAVEPEPPVTEPEAERTVNTETGEIIEGGHVEEQMAEQARIKAEQEEAHKAELQRKREEEAARGPEKLAEARAANEAAKAQARDELATEHAVEVVTAELPQDDPSDPNRVIRPSRSREGEVDVITGTRHVTAHFDIQEAYSLYFDRLKRPVRDIVAFCDAMEFMYGSVAEGVKAAKAEQLLEWDAICKKFDLPTDRDLKVDAAIAAQAPPPPKPAAEPDLAPGGINAGRETELASIFVREDLDARVQGWLTRDESLPPPALVEAYIAHIKKLGSQPNAQMLHHMNANHTFLEACEADGMELAEGE